MQSEFFQDKFPPFSIFVQMSGKFEKLLCPQCGGNELNPFGSSAYKCESCGTILKEEREEKVSPDTHFVAPVSSDFKNSLESDHSGFLNSEERYGEDFEQKVENMNGDSFLKMIVLFGVLLIVALIAAYFLS